MRWPPAPRVGRPRGAKERRERARIGFNLKHFGGNGFLVATYSNMSRGEELALAGAGDKKVETGAQARVGMVEMGDASEKSKVVGLVLPV